MKFIFYDRGSKSRNLGLLGSFVTLEIFVDLQQFLTYGSDGLMYRETCSKRTLRTQKDVGHSLNLLTEKVATHPPPS